MQQFFINRDSTLPYLEIEPTNDGRSDFKKLYYAIQSAKVTFSMSDSETGIKKVANSPCEIVFFTDSDCTERFIIRYKWKKRDTNTKGVYKGQFKITFDGNIAMENTDFPSGDLIVPISEELFVVVL